MQDRGAQHWAGLDAGPGRELLDGWPDDAALTRGVLGRRIVSWLADGVIVAVLLILLHVGLLALGLLTLGLGLPLLGLLPAVPFLYTWLCVAGFGATPGQAFAGVGVRGANLSHPSGLQALLYTTGYWLTLATGGLLFAVALVTRRHRALHDMLAGVLVMRTDEPGRASRRFRGVVA